MRTNSKGMSCEEFVGMMRERGYTYDAESGHFMTVRGVIAGKTTRNGYRTLMLQKDNVKYTFCEHRCVWTWFNGAIPEGKEINHIDFDRGNNRIENLELVTHSANMKHTIDNGRWDAPAAEKSGKAKYTNREVQTMRLLRGLGWPIKLIAELFDSKNVNVIGRLINGRRYGSVKDDIAVMDAYQIIVDRATEIGVSI